MKKIHKLSESGETIVEVLISMALIAATISAAYVSGVNTTHMIQAANEKQAAVSLARQQIELIASDTNISSFTTGTCLLLSLSLGSISNGTSNDCNITVGAVSYYLADTAVVPVANGVDGNEYKISISWTGSSGPSSVTMFYIRKT